MGVGDGEAGPCEWGDGEAEKRNLLNPERLRRIERSQQGEIMDNRAYKRDIGRESKRDRGRQRERKMETESGGERSRERYRRQTDRDINKILQILKTINTCRFSTLNVNSNLEY